MDYKLQDLIDVPLTQALQDRLDKLFPFPAAIIDNEGNILTATAWQDICTQFHRLHPECKKACLASDRYITEHIHEAKPAVTYRCPHGLIDNATPIIIDGQHLGNFFTGQLFLGPPDLDLFRRQAKKYGFDESAYLAAVAKVPVWSQEKLDQHLDFIQGFVQILADSGHRKLLEIQARGQAEIKDLELRKSQSQYQAIIENSTAGFALHEIVLDASGAPVDYVFLDANPAFERLTGLHAADIIGRRATAVLPGIEQESFIKTYGQVALTGAPTHFEQYSELLHKHYDITAYRVPEKRFVTLFQDITGRKQLEQSLRENEARIRSISDNLSSGMIYQVITRPGGGKKITYISDSVRRLYGISPEQAMADANLIYSRMHEDDIKPLLEAEAAATRTLSTFKKEARVHDPAGGIRWSSFVSTPKLLKDGSICWDGIEFIITERKQAEQALQDSERRLATLINNLPGVVYRCGNDPKWTMKYLSPGCRDLTGYAPEDLLDNAKIAYRELILPEGRQALWDTTQAAIKDRRPYQYNYRIRTADGQIRWVWEQGTPIFDPQDGSVSLEGFIFDITEQKLAQEKAQHAAQLLQAALDCSQVGIVIADSRTQTLQYANDFGLRSRGLTRNDLALGLSVEAYTSHGQAFHPDGTPFSKKDLPLILSLAGETVTTELLIRLDDGTENSVMANAAPLRSPTGEVTAGIVVFQDMTERHKAENVRIELEKQLRQSQKMEAVGRLAGGIAHDFNNLLTAISSYGEMLRNDFAATDPRRVQAQEIVDAAARAAALTRQLLIFSRRQIISPSILDLNSEVKSMAKMLQRLIGENITLKTELASGSCLVMADPGQIEQVILNLAVNARDAMPEGGTLTFRTEASEPSEELLRANPELPRTPLVCLSAVDTGIGMDKELIRKIFEPFFTTKGPGKGTGLGLPIVFGIVKQGGGEIVVESQPGQGAAFKIYLPLASVPQERSPLPVPPPPASGHETILLVEDEAVVRRLEISSLNNYGYTVLPAGNGQEALALLKSRPQPIDLVVTDVIMPGMNGRALAQEVKKTHPQAKILYVSGFTDDAIAPHGVVQPGLSLLRKPFNPEALALKVREVLDGPADQAQA
ncbi:MAG: PocR ligand-binding domain-containing protein [Elusimicrobiota bacterium]|jgi:PAS domain S-box-containing protein